MAHNSPMPLRPGVYPAAVTPFDSDGRIDMPAVARLLAYFESKGCMGAVLAGTNGEGPSLSAVEKRDLIRAAVPLRGTLDIILGIATPSLDEAKWSCDQAAKAGAVAALVMAPGYFREASAEGIVSWFEELLESSSLPILVYNFPQRTGVEITAEMMSELSAYPQFAGLKDSSGSKENITAYPNSLGLGTEIKNQKSKIENQWSMFVGNETLLWDALDAGWSGTISGAANVVPGWLAEVVNNYPSESAKAKFDLLGLALSKFRAAPQPPTYKALLNYMGVLPSGEMRLPLLEAHTEALLAVKNEVEAILGAL